MKITIVFAALFCLAAAQVDDCKDSRKTLKNCLEKGWTPDGQELNTEECKVGEEASVSKKKAKKCSEAEVSHVQNGCPALCKKEPEEEVEEATEESFFLENLFQEEEEEESAEEAEARRIEECTLEGINLPGDQLSPNYYEGYPTVASCAKKCQATPGCRAIGLKKVAQRCFVKGGNHGPARPDTSGRPTASLRLCCLEGTC